MKFGAVGICKAFLSSFQFVPLQLIYFCCAICSYWGPVKSVCAAD